ncbi:MAG TPA: D-alanine--D-alanine ligase [Patescibacteria group bacterium]|jgi:D-alanine-D-alanine ligase|nr:D-alanine--D-alanine ligase [Patescibacteria group bacterium]
MAEKKIRVGVLAGGASAERQISLASGLQIAEQLPKDRYEVVMMDPLALMAHNPALSDEQRAMAARLASGAAPAEALPDRDRELPAQMQDSMHRGSSALASASSALTGEGIDVAFIALHGPWGEDGKIQAVLETFGIPYTGSGVLASALAMDKAMAKTVLAANGIDVPRGVLVSSPADRPSIAPPSIVKPVENGSSVGVSMVDDAKDYPAAITEALRYDRRALVEERLFGTELTVGVIGPDHDLQALPVIEIVPKRAFFDYRAKYDSGLSDEICPARVPDAVAKRAQDIALRAHRALGCTAISRTDLIWSPAQGDRMVVLEVNTMPGMTANSLVPKAARVAGISFPELVERLVGWALADREHGRR